MKAVIEMQVLRASRTAILLAAAWLLVGSTALADPARLSHGRFKDLRIYQPIAAPKSFAIFLSDDLGWTATSDSVARQLVQQGAMVAGVDSAQFKASLQSDGGQCIFPDGDLENLSHFIQAYYHAPTYLAPLLVGTGSGASMAYAMLAQAPRNTFAGALSLGFCPNLAMDKPLCRGAGVEFVKNPRGRGVQLLPAKSLGNPWVVLRGADDRSCPAAAADEFVAHVNGAAIVTLPHVDQEFAAAYASLATHNPMTRVAPPPSSLSDLPVIEIPAQAPAVGSTAAEVFAILMSGDGGWAGLDQDVAVALAAKGIPVVGLDSLRYYWTPRSPQGLAADTDRMIRYYLAHFAKHRVLLIGYSRAPTCCRSR